MSLGLYLWPRPCAILSVAQCVRAGRWTNRCPGRDRMGKGWEKDGKRMGKGWDNSMNSQENESPSGGDAADVTVAGQGEHQTLSADARSGGQANMRATEAVMQQTVKKPANATADSPPAGAHQLTVTRPSSIDDDGNGGDKTDALSGDEQIPYLLLLLFPSALRAGIASIPQWIRFKMIAFFGVCSMIAPLALWIAPSMKIWLSILGGSLLSIFFCWALVWFGPEDHY